ncbi:MAG: hypothetical protein ACOX0E_10590 [Syntrophomonadaceae bacterium]|jgi:hypothetical protein
MKLKSRRGIVLIIMSAVLLVLPVFIDIYSINFYYAFTLICLIGAFYRISKEEHFEAKFYHRWKNARKHGFWINVILEGLRAFIFMTVLVIMTQYIGNGITPWQIVLQLPGRILLRLLVVLLLFSIAAGVAAWYENNKRWEKINRTMA